MRHMNSQDQVIDFSDQRLIAECIDKQAVRTLRGDTAGSDQQYKVTNCIRK